MTDLRSDCLLAYQLQQSKNTLKASQLYIDFWSYTACNRTVYFGSGQVKGAWAEFFESALSKCIDLDHSVKVLPRQHCRLNI